VAHAPGPEGNVSARPRPRVHRLAVAVVEHPLPNSAECPHVPIPRPGGDHDRKARVFVPPIQLPRTGQGGQHPPPDGSPRIMACGTPRCEVGHITVTVHHILTSRAAIGEYVPYAS